MAGELEVWPALALPACDDARELTDRDAVLAIGVAASDSARVMAGELTALWRLSAGSAGARPEGSASPVVSNVADIMAGELEGEGWLEDDARELADVGLGSGMAASDTSACVSFSSPAAFCTLTCALTLRRLFAVVEESSLKTDATSQLGGCGYSFRRDTCKLKRTKHSAENHGMVQPLSKMRQSNTINALYPFEHLVRQKFCFEVGQCQGGRSRCLIDRGEVHPKDIH